MHDEFLHGVEEIYTEVTVAMNDRLNELKAAERMPEASGQSPLHASEYGDGARGNELQLQIVKIGTFDGDLLRWSEFRDVFIAMVHSRANVPKITKLHILRRSVTGDAKSAGSLAT